MFTKYSKGVNIPQNYSGDRFRKEIEETKTTVHRAQDTISSISTVRTSVSPSFQDAIEKKVAETLTPEEAVTAEIDKDDFEENEETQTKEQRAEQVENTSPALLSFLKASGINHLWESIRKDDLLLIALIILLSSDKDGNGLDAIVILALLLLYRT